MSEYVCVQATHTYARRQVDSKRARKSESEGKRSRSLSLSFSKRVLTSCFRSLVSSFLPLSSLSLADEAAEREEHKHTHTHSDDVDSGLGRERCGRHT